MVQPTRVWRLMERLCFMPLMRKEDYIIDEDLDEDRCQISEGFVPENIIRLRRFAVGLLKSKGVNTASLKNAIAQFYPSQGSGLSEK